MVEILSASMTDATTTRITHALTDAEKATLKTECAKCNVVLCCVEANYTYGGQRQYEACSGVATGKSIIDFLDSPVASNSVTVVNSNSSNSPIIVINNNGIVAGFRSTNVSEANVTVKIYGLIL